MNALTEIEFDRADLAPAGDPAASAGSPLRAVGRMMRGRWLAASAAAALLAPALGLAGWLSGTPLYSGAAILRVFPQESNILYRTGDDSVLKTFDSFVKAETTSVASAPVMARARAALAADWPEMAGDMTADDLGRSIEIKRVDSLITLNTLSRDAGFAAAKITAVMDSYLALQAEAEAGRSQVRLHELQTREAALQTRRDAIRARILEVGAEYGPEALAKAHVEKVAQIDALAARRAEVEATLAAMRAASGSSADMSDSEIMRATLLDRALADLNFDRAKREAELATLTARYPERAAVVRDKREQIAVIDRAMAERREQIKLLGQTGALTDTSSSNPKTSEAEIAALLDKIAGQLAAARAEARDLNAKRAELAALQEDAEDTRKLLEETSDALEVIRLEAGRALPGYSAVLSPATAATEPAQDDRKMLAAGGLAAGGLLPFLLALGLGLTGRRLRYSDDIPADLRLVQAMTDDQGVDRLRNALQLLPLRVPQSPGAARLIAVTRPAPGARGELAMALAESFARSGSRVLLVDGHPEGSGPSASCTAPGTEGWRECLAGRKVAPVRLPSGLDILPSGAQSSLSAGRIGVQALRSSLAALAESRDVVLIAIPSPRECLTSELVLSVVDLGLVELRPQDRKADLESLAPRLDRLPRQGGAAVLTHARRNDPALRL
ncbi:hypothetical protein [Neotabrizicola shimadae]|uniref:Uncharacterized protein n=1 Tax=Neotabrizicola shimadae TaxID=2807096 RepID=A0A8G0ZUT2_9RHOB|nr:hypothetical protein [Neotabrizicola shimadae]QYZ69217.1 hypothetical protein JO391_15965 [Neotabrizicola shimadae]